MMGPVVYIVGTLTTLLCAVMLLLAYRRSGHRLLLFSGLCFAGLAASNGLVFIDLVVAPEVNLYVWRLGSAVLAMSLMLYALIWERH